MTFNAIRRVMSSSMRFHVVALPTIRRSCRHDVVLTTSRSLHRPRHHTPSHKPKRARLRPNIIISNHHHHETQLGPYGLSKVDYQHNSNKNKNFPPRWPLPPPPPPPKNPIRRYFPVGTFLLATAVGVYIYFNQDENVYEYWRQVEQGNVPLDDDDDDDDGSDGEVDDDDDNDDDDEWEDANSDNNKR